MGESISGEYYETGKYPQFPHRSYFRRHFVSKKEIQEYETSVEDDSMSSLGRTPKCLSRKIRKDGRKNNARHKEYDTENCHMGERVYRIFFSPAEQRDDTEKSSEYEENKYFNRLVVVSRHNKRGKNRRIIRAYKHDWD